MTDEEKEALRNAAEALISLGDHYGFQVLMAQLRQEVQEDLIALSECDPTDNKAIAELQYRIKGLNWIKERRQILIVQGIQPEILEQTQAEYIDG